jgi:hypothetical protein
MNKSMVIDFKKHFSFEKERGKSFKPSILQLLELSSVDMADQLD